MFFEYLGSLTFERVIKWQLLLLILGRIEFPKLLGKLS